MAMSAARGGFLSPGHLVRRGVAAMSAVLASWRYAGGKRDRRFDLLRGFAVFAMVADHIGGLESWLFAVTGGNRFWVSAAESFVCISGLMMGIVYRDVLARRGLRAALLKILQRAWLLYRLTVILTFVTAALAVRLQFSWAPQINPAERLDFVVGVLTLHQTFFMTDVLLLYTLLVLVAAPALVALAEGRTWLVLACSWTLWALWQRWPQAAALPWAIRDNALFQMAAWQILFFTAMVIGYHRERLARVSGRLTGRTALVVSGALLAVTIQLYRTQLAWFRYRTVHSYDFFETHLFGKPDERIGRLVVFAILAVFTVSLVTQVWVPLRRAVGWLLLPLGEQALWAYCLHLFVLGLAEKSGLRLFGPGEHAARQNAAMQSAGILLIWLAIVLGRRALPAIRTLRTPLIAGWPTMVGWSTRRVALVLAPILIVASVPTASGRLARPGDPPTPVIAGATVGRLTATSALVWSVEATGSGIAPAAKRDYLLPADPNPDSLVESEPARMPRRRRRMGALQEN